MHIHILSTDLIVWMLMVRGFFSVVAGSLMLLEPMQCGGSNKTLHWIISAVLVMGGINAWDRAIGRAVAVGTNGSSIPVDSLVLSESLMLTAVLVLVIKLGYDFYHYREACKVNPKYKFCNPQKDCPRLKKGTCDG